MVVVKGIKIGKEEEWEEEWGWGMGNGKCGRKEEGGVFASVQLFDQTRVKACCFVLLSGLGVIVLPRTKREQSKGNAADSFTAFAQLAQLAHSAQLSRRACEYLFSDSYSRI
jgi:hypothetical protein